jgi:hypothetical protein
LQYKHKKLLQLAVAHDLHLTRWCLSDFNVLSSDASCVTSNEISTLATTIKQCVLTAGIVADIKAQDRCVRSVLIETPYI